MATEEEAFPSVSVPNNAVFDSGSIPTAINIGDSTGLTLTDLGGVGARIFTTTSRELGQFVRVVELGSGDSHLFSYDNIDTATINALDTATDEAEILEALRGLQYLEINLVAPVPGNTYLVEISIVPDEVAGDETGSDSVILFQSYFTILATGAESALYEFTLNKEDAYLEFTLEPWYNAYLEFTLNTPDAYLEFTLEEWVDAYYEFTLNAPDAFYEFTLRPDFLNIENLTELPIYSEDCANATVSLDTSNYTVTGGETFTIEVTKDEEQIDIDYKAVDKSWTIPTTEDGLYTVTITSSVNGVIAIRPYILDCRTRKCITRIADQDTEAYMNEELCEPNSDWIIIFTLWKAIQVSYYSGNFSTINTMFNKLKSYCKECNQSNCAC